MKCMQPSIWPSIHLPIVCLGQGHGDGSSNWIVETAFKYGEIFSRVALKMHIYFHPAEIKNEYESRRIITVVFLFFLVTAQTTKRYGFRISGHAEKRTSLTELIVNWNKDDRNVFHSTNPHTSIIPQGLLPKLCVPSQAEKLHDAASRTEHCIAFPWNFYL